MAITNPDDINDLFGLFESDAGIVTQNNVGVGSSPSDVNLWDNLKLISPGNLIQADENLMPEFRSVATPNNSPAVRFDGVDELLKTISPFFLLDSHTVAMVVQFPPALPLVNPVTLIQIIASGLGGEVLRITPLGDLVIQNEGGTSIAASVPVNAGWTLGSWAIVVYTVAQGTPLDQFDLRIDQIPFGPSGFMSVDAPFGVSLGSFEDGTESAEIDVASVVMYKRKLTGPEIVDLENFLFDKYFVLAPPPPPLAPPVVPVLAPRSGVGLKRKEVRFSDLDLDFLVNPITGALQRKLDSEAVKRSVRNLIQLNRYEKPFHPEIDPGVRGLLFELVTPATAVLLQRRITELLNHYEPRIELLAVDVVDQIDSNLYNVTIEFRVVNRDESVIVNLALTRLR